LLATESIDSEVYLSQIKVLLEHDLEIKCSLLTSIIDMDMNDVNDLVFDASPDFDLAVSLEARVIVYLICLKSDCAAFSVYDRGYFVTVVLHVVFL